MNISYYHCVIIHEYMNIMSLETKKVRYPKNLPLKNLVKSSGKSVVFLAKEIGITREILSKTINGHNKGSKRIVGALLDQLGLTEEDLINAATPAEGNNVVGTQIQ